MSDTYKPTDHDGMKADGTPDKRVGTGEFAHGQLDPHEVGAKGGKASGVGVGSGDSGAATGDYQPTEHGGVRKDGKPDGRVKQ